MGILSLLAYVLGGAIVGVMSYATIDRVASGRAFGEALLFVSIGAALIGLGAVLHAFRVRREGKDTSSEWIPPSSSLFFALVLWLGPVASGWLQFELYNDPVWVFPFLTMIGAVLLVYLAVWRKTPRDRYGAVKRTVAAALVGLPLGFLATGVPLAHYRKHLTTVVLGVEEDPSEGYPLIEMEPSEPYLEMPAERHDELFELVDAVANAEEVNVADAIALGEMKFDEDGELLRVLPDGSTAPLNDASELEAMLNEATDNDRAASRAAREEARKAHAERVERLRRGGRLFSGWGD